MSARPHFARRDIACLRPELAAFFAIGCSHQSPAKHAEASPRGVLAELARHGRP